MQQRVTCPSSPLAGDASLLVILLENVDAFWNEIASGGKLTPRSLIEQVGRRAWLHTARARLRASSPSQIHF